MLIYNESDGADLAVDRFDATAPRFKFKIVDQERQHYPDNRSWLTSLEAESLSCLGTDRDQFSAPLTLRFVDYGRTGRPNVHISDGMESFDRSVDHLKIFFEADDPTNPAYVTTETVVIHFVAYYVYSVQIDSLGCTTTANYGLLV